MKTQLQKLATIAIIILANIATIAHGQTATWALTADQSVSTTGTISASPQSLSVLSIGSYGGLNGPLNVPSQRARVSSGWPHDAAYVPARYYEYVVSVTSGSFNSVTVSIPMGISATNNLRAEIFYSTDNFASSTQLNTSGTIVFPTNTFLTPTPTYSFNLPLTTGNSLSVRVFPWYTGTDASTSRYVYMQNVQISLSATVLPVGLMSVNSALADGKATIKWSTTNEVNVDHFEVERSATSDIFTTAGTVKAKNAASNDYSFTDDQLVTARTYYRVKTVDKDGHFSYSQVLVVDGKASLKLSVYPNPAISNLVVTHTKATGNALIKIVSMDGRIVSECKVAQASTQTSFPVNMLTKGLYEVVYVDEQGRSSVQFVKE